MRRSIAAFVLSLALVAGSVSPHPSHAAAQAIPGPGPAALLVGIGWIDPVSSAEAGVWAAIELTRLVQFLEDACDHMKGDVRRATEHPQWNIPRVHPVEPPISPELRPVPTGPKPRRLAAPDPIPDSLPARLLS